MSTQDAVGPVGSALRRRNGVDATAGMQFCARLNDSSILSAFFRVKPAAASTRAVKIWRVTIEIRQIEDRNGI